MSHRGLQNVRKFLCGYLCGGPTVNTLIIIPIALALLLGLLFLLLFCWAVKDGQFTDVEEAKYILFREPKD
ncbi:MAG TPA: cbb3-type cytochrome oxidase assembly protein CcoS [Bdellovibrionales bacterium]|nr:cbb3-type cytochrome oxidase assembly protein CcoS [Bdellovibrionales bacterium]